MFEQLLKNTMDVQHIDILRDYDLLFIVKVNNKHYIIDDYTTNAFDINFDNIISIKKFAHKCVIVLTKTKLHIITKKYKSNKFMHNVCNITEYKDMLVYFTLSVDVDDKIYCTSGNINHKGPIHFEYTLVLISETNYCSKYRLCIDQNNEFYIDEFVTNDLGQINENIIFTPLNGLGYITKVNNKYNVYVRGIHWIVEKFVLESCPVYFNIIDTLGIICESNKSSRIFSINNYHYCIRTHDHIISSYSKDTIFREFQHKYYTCDLSGGYDKYYMSNTIQEWEKKNNPEQLYYFQYNDRSLNPILYDSTDCYYDSTFYLHDNKIFIGWEYNGIYDTAAFIDQIFEFNPEMIYKNDIINFIICLKEHGYLKYITKYIIKEIYSYIANYNVTIT